MDLLQEAKQANKRAYNELILKYKHIFYKLAKIYLIDDENVYKAFKTSFSTTFCKLNNINSEKEFLYVALKNLIRDCKYLKRKYSKKKLEKELTVNITETITSSETSIAFEEYQEYRRKSIVGEIITSIDEEFRLVAFLYYYANLSTAEISKITKSSEDNVIQKIDSIRIKIYEIIKTKEVDW